jgi:hypothetical protein
MPTEFKAKTWIYIPSAILFIFLTAFCAILGPLFLFEVLKDANRAPARDAGIALCIFSIVFLLISILAVYQLKVLRHPTLRLCREGIVAVVLGSSTLDNIPLIPNVVKAVIAVLSGQGFKRKFACIPWTCFSEASVSGYSMAKTLVITASKPWPNLLALPENAVRVQQLVLQEAGFRAPLNLIAQSINWYAGSSDDRATLPSWRDQ